MECAPVQTLMRFKIRETKKSKIIDLFSANIGVRYGTLILHGIFGTAFRSRVSEINRDEKCPIVIKNQTYVAEGDQETSVYWAEKKC